jgi:hypothetical protein
MLALWGLKVSDGVATAICAALAVISFLVLSAFGLIK